MTRAANVGLVVLLIAYTSAWAGLAEGRAEERKHWRRRRWSRPRQGRAQREFARSVVTSTSGSSEITLCRRPPHHHPSASGLLPAASKPAHAIAGLAIAHSSRPTHRQHHPFTSTPPQLRMVQRGPRPPHAQRIPRITRTQSPPRGRMCSVVPLALCARATPVVPVPHPSRFSKTHAACTSHAVQGRLRPGSTRVVPSSQLFCTSSLWRCRHTQE